MLPLAVNILRLEEIADYWSRELNYVRSKIEIHNELLAAFWQSQLIVYGASRSTLVERRNFLKTINLRRKHPGFTIIEDEGQRPPKITKHLDGSVSIDTTVYVLLPSDEAAWDSEVLNPVYETLATRSFADFDDLVKPGLLVLSTTREALGAYCDSVPYPRPRFWFRDSEKAKGFGGRPSVVRQITAEMTRRAELGFLAPTLREEARALRSWAEQNIGEAIQLPQVRSIENAIREHYHKLQAAASAGAHKT